MRKTGFSLVEMLVVVGIIAILITIMVPQVQGAITKAKEQATIQKIASLEAALGNYAANHNGHYPGSAVDIMAPYPNYGLGDPDFVAGSSPASPPNNPSPVGLSIGIIGGRSTSLQAIKNARDNSPAISQDSTPRYFDSLILDNSLQEFPPNELKRGGGAEIPIYNIFRYEAQDPTNINTFVPYLYVSNNEAQSLPVALGDAGRVRYTGIPNNGVLYDNFGANQLSDDDLFFSEGDFAYVPLLTQTPFPMADDPNTPENDQYRWSTLVNGYLIFAYGTRNNRLNKYADAKQKFGLEGIPGMNGGLTPPPGAPGIDTPYEFAVYNLFNGAIYYNRK